MVGALLGLAACGERTITITVPDNLGSAPTAAPAASSAPVAAPQYVCTAVKLGAAGEWGAAQTHWFTNETQTTNLQASSAFLQLEADTSAIALDQYAKKPTALDVATYQADLAGDAALTVGC